MDDLLRTALDAAEAAARIHRKHAGELGSLRISEKRGYANFVSEVDLESQEAALAVIRERHPLHEIMAEEDEDEQLEAGLEFRDEERDAPVWIVDPLDGTTNFLHGHPMYAASVAVAVDGEPVAGAVVAHATGERWWAARDIGAWKNGDRIQVSEVRDMEGALVGTGFPFKVPDAIPRYLEELGRVLRASSGVRRGGAAAVDLCYLASGILDAFWELYLNPWDIAAGLVILQEAGGTARRVDGSPLDVRAPGTVLAANSEELMEELGRVVRG